jgi:hypothetical protein
MAINKHKSGAYVLTAFLLVLSNITFGFPVDMLVNAWNEGKIVDVLYWSSKDSHIVDSNIVSLPKLPELTPRVHAAGNFSIQTGYYIGNGSSQSISGLGFQPESVIIKANTAAGQTVWKTNSMAATNTAYLSATANDTASMITLDSDGFTLSNSAQVNTANVRYIWTAFAGSDCSASGTICIGAYTGNGAASRKITTGFQPAYTMVKRSTNIAGSFRTTPMASNLGQYFATTAQVTNGTLFSTLDADGFTVGSINNTNTGTYYYMALKATTGLMAVGSYTGDGTDNRSITGYGSGSTPNFVIIKNATSLTTASRNAIMGNTNSDGDHASYIASATANVVNGLQKLQDNGFQVGALANANESSQTIYWAAFGGAAALPAGSGAFDMATGSYTGNGTSQSITSLDFSPDLVIIKDSSTGLGVFRTSLMAADNTAYLASATANFTGGITSLASDGFSIGASSTVNTSSSTYYWQAFGNAYKPTTRTGSADFAVGAHTGNGIDSRDINELPFQPDMIAIKRSGATAGTWRSSANTGDQSSFFAATAEAANRVQSLNTFGYQIGTQAEVNSSGNLYNWFAFKNDSNFTVGTYTGTGSNQTIDTTFRPSLVWVKRNTTGGGTVHKNESLAGNSTQHFLGTANFTNGITITSLLDNGFTLASTTAATNASGGTYRYAAWRAPPPNILTTDIVDGNGQSIANPSLSFNNINSSLSCQNSSGLLGISSQKLRITNGTSNGNWTLTIAATGGTAANWNNGTNAYDFNDANGTPNGCSDGGDTDSLAGRLSIDASAGTLTPEGGCSSAGITKGSASAFSQSVVDSITLLAASSSQTGCRYDLTNIGLSQQIPAETPANASAYTINMTLTITAN